MEKYISVNLNDYVLIEITDLGWKYLKETLGEYYVEHCILINKVVIDDVDWYRFVLHNVFDYFPVRFGGQLLYKTRFLLETF